MGNGLKPLSHRQPGEPDWRKQTYLLIHRRHSVSIVSIVSLMALFSLMVVGTGAALALYVLSQLPPTLGQETPCGSPLVVGSTTPWKGR